VAVVGQREITALQLVATQRPNSTDAQGRTVRHPGSKITGRGALPHRTGPSGLTIATFGKPATWIRKCEKAWVDALHHSRRNKHGFPVQRQQSRRCVT
jgi:hypothetical protein